MPSTLIARTSTPAALQFVRPLRDFRQFLNTRGTPLRPQIDQNSLPLQGGHRRPFAVERSIVQLGQMHRRRTDNPRASAGRWRLRNRWRQLNDSLRGWHPKFSRVFAFYHLIPGIALQTGERFRLAIRPAHHNPVNLLG